MLSLHLDDLFTKLITKGAHCQFATLEKGSIVHVPAGFFCFEWAKSGPLNFGIRKSFFHKSALSRERHAQVVALIEQDGKDVAQSKAILPLF